MNRSIPFGTALYIIPKFFDSCFFSFFSFFSKKENIYAFHMQQPFFYVLVEFSDAPKTWFGERLSPAIRIIQISLKFLTYCPE